MNVYILLPINRIFDIKTKVKKNQSLIKKSVK